MLKLNNKESKKNEGMNYKNWGKYLILISCLKMLHLVFILDLLFQKNNNKKKKKERKKERKTT